MTPDPGRCYLHTDLPRKSWGAMAGVLEDGIVGQPEEILLGRPECARSEYRQPGAGEPGSQPAHPDHRQHRRPVADPRDERVDVEANVILIAHPENKMLGALPALVGAAIEDRPFARRGDQPARSALGVACARAVALRNGVVMLEDLKSTNGTLLNDRRSPEARRSTAATGSRSARCISSSCRSAIPSMHITRRSTTSSCATGSPRSTTRESTTRKRSASSPAPPGTIARCRW